MAWTGLIRSDILVAAGNGGNLDVVQREKVARVFRLEDVAHNRMQVTVGDAAGKRGNGEGYHGRIARGDKGR